MENASKALIVAGTILLAILLISISILTLNATAGMREEAGRAADNVEVQSFNEQFTSYEGGMINASLVKSLLLFVRASNAHYGFQDGAPSGTDKYVEVEGIASSNMLYANKTYHVYVTKYNDNGYISTIKVDLNP